MTEHLNCGNTEGMDAARSTVLWSSLQLQLVELLNCSSQNGHGSAFIIWEYFWILTCRAVIFWQRTIHTSSPTGAKMAAVGLLYGPCVDLCRTCFWPAAPCWSQWTVVQRFDRCPLWCCTERSRCPASRRAGSWAMLPYRIQLRRLEPSSLRTGTLRHHHASITLARRHGAIKSPHSP